MRILREPRLLLCAGSLILAPSVVAQNQYDQDEMKANFAEMQTHDWFTGGGWITDFALAKQRASEAGKPIFAYFTRTYAP